MDNTQNLSSALLNSKSDSGLSSLGLSSTDNSIGSSVSNASSGVFGFLSNINGITWVAIILILAFLGFNVFVYLAKGTQDIANFFDPIFKKVFGITLIAAGGAVDLTAEGAKTVVNTTANVVDATADVLDSGLTKIQDLTPEGHMANSSVPSSQPPSNQPDIMANNSLNQTLNTNQYQQPQSNEYEADEAKSSVYSTGQGGWCYIGEDKGYRTCAQVSPSDTCMSGDIFPSQQICINPNLRP
jgi:hypothetical protein